LRQGDFRLISHGGFGDGMNAYAHSMAWFNDRLYAGTMRGNFPLMKRRLPIGMNPWPVECPEDPFRLDMRAEIWCYDPSENSWERVYKSPLIIGSHGKRIPRELGLRGMFARKADSGDHAALYVSTFSPARGPGPVLLRSEDGREFVPSCEPGLCGLPVTAIRSVTEFKGRLYTTPAGSRGGKPNLSFHAVVYESRDPARGRWEPVSDHGFGDPENVTIFEMEPFGEHLYVGTFNLNGYQVWRSRMAGEAPYRWERVIQRGAYRGPLNEAVISMRSFKGALYVGSAIQGGGVDRQNKVGPAPPELIRIHPDCSWDLVVGEPRDTPDGFKEPLSGYMPGFDNFFNGYFWRLCDHGGWLYLSSFDWSGILPYATRSTWPAAFASIVDALGDQFIHDHHAGFDLYRSFDGENWVPVTCDGMGNPYNIGLRTMVSTPVGLFLGTANPFGPKIWPLKGDRYVRNPRGGCEVFFAPSRLRPSECDVARSIPSHPGGRTSEPGAAVTGTRRFDH
jgi:hypothetical protein